jgi:syndecan 1
MTPSAATATAIPSIPHRPRRTGVATAAAATTAGGGGNGVRLPECVVCLGAEVQVALLPCGHAQLCAACGAVLRRCPSCRALVAMKVRIYL